MRWKMGHWADISVPVLFNNGRKGRRGTMFCREREQMEQRASSSQEKKDYGGKMDSAWLLDFLFLSLPALDWRPFFLLALSLVRPRFLFHFWGTKKCELWLCSPGGEWYCTNMVRFLWRNVNNVDLISLQLAEVGRELSDVENVVAITHSTRKAISYNPSTIFCREGCFPVFFPVGNYVVWVTRWSTS